MDHPKFVGACVVASGALIAGSILTVQFHATSQSSYQAGGNATAGFLLDTKEGDLCMWRDGGRVDRPSTLQCLTLAELKEEAARRTNE